MTGKPEKERRGRRTRPAAGNATGVANDESASVRVSGGRFKPLSSGQADQINEAVLTILESIGLTDGPDLLVDTVVAAGGAVTEDNRLLFPRALTQRALSGLCKRVDLHGQNPGHELILADRNVYVGSGGAAPSVIDLDNGEYRPSTLRDLYDAARLVDTLEHIHFFSRSLVARYAGRGVS